MPKIIGTTLREHREQVRVRLFTALAELIGEMGFDAVTLSQIATRAGVGRTAIYNHFPDKEAMLVGLVMHETAEWAQVVEAALVGVDDPVEQLRTYVRQRLALAPGHHFSPGADMRQVISAKTQVEIRRHVVLVERVLRRVLERGVQAGVFPEQNLDVTTPLVMSCLSGRAIARSTDTHCGAEQIEEFVLRAVGVTTPVR